MSEAPPPDPAALDAPARWRAQLRKPRWVVAAGTLTLSTLLAILLWRDEPPSPATPQPQPSVDASVSMAPPAQHKLIGERKLTGRVLDDRNEPLVDARVRVSSLDDADALPWEAVTDKGGRFALTDLVPHALSVEVSRPGHDATERTLRADDAGELTFVLARQGELMVTLRDAPGHPVEGAVVIVSGPGLWPAVELRANAAGEVLFENLALGEYSARARRDARVAPSSQKVRVVPGERARVVLTLQEGLTLQARVVDRTAGEALPDAELAAYDPTPSIAPRTAHSDADGSISLQGFGPGELRLELRHAGHAPRSLDVKLPLDEPLRIELDGEATLSGSVVDEKGNPVGGALLSVATREGLPIQLDHAHDSKARGSGELGVTRGPVPKIPIASSSETTIGTLASATDALGAFRIAGLPPTPVTVGAAHPGYAAAQVEVRDLAPHAERRDVRIVLREAGRVEGLIRDARDHPVVGVYVSSRGDGGSEHSAITDNSGRFALLDVIGELTISAEAQGYTPLTCKVRVEARQTARCDLTVGLTLYELNVRVLDEFGFGLEGAVVSLSAKATARIFTQVTRRDGGAVLRELPEPPYNLEAALHGFVPATLEVTTPEREQHLKLQRAASLGGTVTDSLGRPVPFALVSTDEGDATTNSDERGAFLLTGVTPGALYVTAAHKSVGEGTSAQVRARGGQTLESVRIVLPGRYSPREGDAPAATLKHSAEEKKAPAERRVKPADFELEQRGGELVFMAVQPGSSAERAGARVGDVLLSIDGETVLSAAQGRGMLRDPPGHTALLSLRRERAQLRLRYRRPNL